MTAFDFFLPPVQSDAISSTLGPAPSSLQSNFSTSRGRDYVAINKPIPPNGPQDPVEVANLGNYFQTWNRGKVTGEPYNPLILPKIGKWVRDCCVLHRITMTLDQLASAESLAKKESDDSDRLATDAKLLDRGSYRVVSADGESLVWVLDNATGLEGLDTVSQAVKHELKNVMPQAF
jgi:hypothetical protein